MKRNQRGAKAEKQNIQVWEYLQAIAAIPYLASIMRSLREARLESQQLHLAARRYARQPGRPDRAAIIAREETLREAAAADQRVEGALAELEALDVYCLDPVNGEALVPFVHDEQLAWYVYDLFDPEPFRFWRFHNDPLHTRRPIEETLPGPGDQVVV
jgi:hypothetical protein